MNTIHEEVPMESRSIVAALQSLSAAVPRRDLLASLSGGVLATSLLAHENSADARKRGGKKRKNTNQKKRKRNTKSDKPKVRVDATCTGAGASGVSHAAGDVLVVQTFTAIRSGPLTKVTIPANNQTDVTGDVVLRLVPVDASGLPTDDVLAEATAPLNAPEDEIVELEFVFADPFSVDAGVDYALVLARPGDGEFVWRGDLGDPCGGSIAVRRFADSPFEPFAEGADLLFTTFVKS